jgi:hypothetical protein
MQVTSLHLQPSGLVIQITGGRKVVEEETQGKEKEIILILGWTIIVERKVYIRQIKKKFFLSN